MERRNSGHGENNLQQNRFTAYFEVAATRYKSRYLARWHTVREREPAYDFQEMPQEIGEDPDLLSGLSLMDTFENEACLRALQSLPSRDLEVLLDKKTLIFRFVPAVGDALVQQGIIASPILNHHISQGLRQALTQP